MCCCDTLFLSLCSERGEKSITETEIYGTETCISVLKKCHEKCKQKVLCLDGYCLLSASVWTGRQPAIVWSTEWASRTSGFMVLKMKRRKRREWWGISTSGWPSSWPGISPFVGCVFGEQTRSRRLTYKRQHVKWYDAFVPEYICTSMIVLMFGCGDLQLLVILSLNWTLNWNPSLLNIN